MAKILITGAGKNIGKILADHLMKSGHTVMIHYNTSNVKSEHSVRLDFSRSFDLFSNLKFIPDVVINNAAIMKKDDFGSGRSSEIFNINYCAPVNISSQFYKINPNGVVINILDAWAQLLSPHFLMYCLSKLALEEYTKGMKSQHKMIGVKIGATLFKDGQNKEIFDKIPQTTVEDVCKAVDFILSEELESGHIIDLTDADTINRKFN